MKNIIPIDRTAPTDVLLDQHNGIIRLLAMVPVRNTQEPAYLSLIDSLDEISAILKERRDAVEAIRFTALDK